MPTTKDILDFVAYAALGYVAIKIVLSLLSRRK